MKEKIIVLLLLASVFSSCSPFGSKSVGRTVVDMAERRVIVPDKISKIFSVNPNGTILVYTFDPELVAGWNYKLSKEVKQFIPAKYAAIADYGQLLGSNVSANEEEIISLSPDLILCAWPISDNLKKRMDRLQMRLGIPIVMLDNSLETIPQAYTLLGELTQNIDRAKLLSEKSRAIIDQTKTRAEKREKAISFYYGFSSKALSTIAGNSIYMEIFSASGYKSAIDKNGKKKISRIKIDLEELLIANPEIVIIGDDNERKNMLAKIKGDSKWQLLDAVTNEQLYAVPNLPFHWIDKPPSVNRLAGLLWLRWIADKDYSDEQFISEISDFYKKFYHIDSKIWIENKRIHLRPPSHNI